MPSMPHSIVQQTIINIMMWLHQQEIEQGFSPRLGSHYEPFILLQPGLLKQLQLLDNICFLKIKIFVLFCFTDQGLVQEENLNLAFSHLSLKQLR